jgi:hypothetical protein
MKRRQLLWRGTGKEQQGKEPKTRQLYKDDATFEHERLVETF